jgi:TolB-like protein
MDVLLALAARPGELVSRQTLLDEVWSDVVVLDDTLTKAVQVLRGHLDDKPGNPEFIRTVPRKGYELIAPVGLLDDEPSSSAAAAAPESPGASAEKPPRVRRWPLGLAAGLVLVTLCITGYYSISRLGGETITVAVIPPVASGESSDLGFVGEGLADYLIDRLSRSRRLEVVARRSSFGMRDTDTNVRAIGDQLGARYLVEGSLRREDEGLLLTLFLVDSEAGTNVWSTQIRGPIDNLSRLQVEAAERVRDAFRRNLGIALDAVVETRQPISELAYRKYLEARYQWTLRGERRIDRSIRLLEEALAIEPDYAAAHLAIAQSVAVRPFYTEAPVASQFERARASAERALNLDPALEAEVAALEGFMLFKERHWTEAQASLLHALNLAPENLNALYWYSWFLSQIGRYDEALSQLLIAQKLDPVSAVVNDRLAIAYVWVNDLEKAAQRYQVAVELGYLESTQPLSLMLFQYRSRQFDELGDLLLRLGGDPDWVRPTIAALEHPEQRKAASDAIDAIAEPDPVLTMTRFGLWLLIGDTDRAFRDFDPGPKSPYVEALWSQEGAHMRADPRFGRLLEDLGFSGADQRLIPEKLLTAAEDR